MQSSATEGAEGSGNSIGAQFLKKKSGNKERNHSGNGTSGNPAEINASITEARKIEDHAEHVLAKLKNDKEGLLFRIADFQVKEKQVMESGLTDEATAYRKEIIRAQKEVDKINGVIPETSTSKDHEHIQKIVSDWYAGERKKKEDLIKIEQAEKVLKDKPGDGHAQGDVNRARAEMQATDVHLGEVAHEAELVLGNKIANPVQDESISTYTHEQALQDAKAHAEKHPKPVKEKTTQEKFSEGWGLIWGKKNEEKVVNETEEPVQPETQPAKLSETEPENNTMENIPPQATANDWQEGAVKNWENEGGKVLEADFEHTPETHDALLPIAKDPKQLELDFTSENGIDPKKIELSAEVPVELRETRPVLNEEQILAYNEKNRLTREKALEVVATIEKVATERVEKSGMNSKFLLNTAIAAALVSILVASVLPKLNVDYSGDKGAQVENIIEQHEYIGTAEEGSSIWEMAKPQLKDYFGEKFTELVPEQQTYLIDAIKDRVATSPLFYGMTDANKLAIDQNVDFGAIFKDENFMNEILSRAQNLTPEEIENIKNYKSRVVEETTNMSAEELPLRTDFTPPEKESSTSIEQTTPSAENLASHPNALLESGNLRGRFNYSPSGTVESFTVEGGVSTADAHSLLNSNWREVVRNNQTAGGADMDINIVSLNATNVLQYEKMIEALDKKGARVSVEAIFLSNYIGKTISDIENIYGDVFKNREDFGKTEQVAPPETVPQEILPEEPKDVLMENYVPPMASEITDNAQALVYAKERVRDIIKEVFGTKGWFLGIGSSNGMEVFSVFANKTVEEVMGANADEMPTGDTGKIQDLLNQAREQTHVKSIPGEKVADYLERATAINIDRFMKNG